MVERGEEGILSFSSTYPRGRGWSHIGKGGVLAMVSLLILPMFILYGYMLQVIAAAYHEENLPPLEGMTDLFIDGLKMFGALLPFLLAYIILAQLPILLAGKSVSGSLALVSLLVYAAGSYVGPVLLMRYAVERNWRTLYTVETFRMAFTRRYLQLFLLFVLFYIGLYIAISIVTLVSAITIIGPVIVLLLGSFYMVVALGAFLGRMYRDLEPRNA